MGSFQVELFPLIAPKAVRYFDSLTTIKFFDSLAFHRVVPGFVIQGGDPNSRNKPRETWGNGDSSQVNVPAEFSNVSYLRGILGAARDTDPNSANSQFFICVANATSLNAQYTAYGRVISGMNICDTIVAAPRDANDNPLKKIIMFVSKSGQNDSVPTVPVMLNPAHNAGRITLDSNLIWSPVTGAVLYGLDIATDSMFTNKVFSSEIGGNSYTLKSVQLGLKKYYWRVRANNGGHRSGYSAVRSFITAVSIPALAQPVNAATGVPGNVTVRWNAVSGAVSYHLQVSTNSVFTAMVVDQKGITDTSKQLNGLQLSKKHYWRVSAETPDYEGAYGLQWNFTTGTSTGAADPTIAPRFYRLDQNFPNPFNPITRVTYSIAIPGTVQFTVIDMLGREVRTFHAGYQDSGEHIFDLAMADLPSGMYLYTIRSGSFTAVRRMMLLK